CRAPRRRRHGAAARPAPDRPVRASERRGPARGGAAAGLWPGRPDPARPRGSGHDRPVLDPAATGGARGLRPAHRPLEGLRDAGARRMSQPPRVLIVEARFYSDLADALLAGARDALEAFGAEHETVTVPGALEIPPAIAMAAASGDWDGFVALGCVIR